MPATPESFKAQLSALTAQIAGRPLDATLDDWLNAVGGASIASHMTSQIAAAKSALEALPSDDLRAPLSSNKQSVLLVYEAVKELSDALKQEFTATLAIKPPSRVDSDND